MNKINVNIIMKNGKKYLVKLIITESKIAIDEILTKYIYKDYNPSAALNINTYDLESNNEYGFNSVAIDMKEISSVEYKSR